MVSRVCRCGVRLWREVGAECLRNRLWLWHRSCSPGKRGTLFPERVTPMGCRVPRMAEGAGRIPAFGGDLLAGTEPPRLSKEHAIDTGLRGGFQRGTRFVNSI